MNTPDTSHIGLTFGSYTVVERIAYDESMKRGLYRCYCRVCGGNSLVWIDLESGKRRFARACWRNHRVRLNPVEQHRAVLMMCAG